jgi:predicted Zn-dependent peptidase
MGYSEIKEEKLKNGLKLILIEDHSTPVSTFQVWYKVGAIDEPEGKSGISHLLEHLMLEEAKTILAMFSQGLFNHRAELTMLLQQRTILFIFRNFRQQNYKLQLI